jgi:hypothetical protein
VSVRKFSKQVYELQVTSGSCSCIDSKGEVLLLRHGDIVKVSHDVQIGGSEFMTDKRALKTFAAGLVSVGFIEQVMQ